METSSVTLAKITQPQVEGVLFREGLFEKLDSCLKKPITWIVGPGGSGKTTLVSSYTKSRNIPCLWFQVDGGDSDLATFFYYLGLAGKKAAPRVPQKLPILTPEYLYGIPEFSRKFFGDLYGRLKVPSLLVFDNYQEADPGSLIHQSITQGLSRLPEGINLVIVSRSVPTSEFSRFQANSQMEIINWNDLRLSFEECQKILDIKQNENISIHDLQNIYLLIDGWAAGLLLLFEAGITKRNPECGSSEGTSEQVFDYFACEVFERQDLDIKEFLIKVSFLPHMTTDMAEKLTDNQSAGRILAWLNRHNLFTERRRQQNITYQFHPLFKEFLQKKALDYYGGEVLMGLKRRTALILQNSNQQEAAARLFSEAEDWKSLTGLVIGQAETLVQQGRNRVLESWISMLPKKLTDSNPWLIFWLAVARMPFFPKESKEFFEKAYHRFVKSNDRLGLFLAWSGVSDSIFLCFTRFHDYDRWLEVYEEIRKKYTPYPSLEIEVRMTASVLNAVVFRQPFHKDYEKIIDRAAQLVETDIDMTSKIQLYQTLCISQIFARNYIRCEFFIKAFKSYIESAPVPPMAFVLQRQAEALYLWFIASFDECHKVIEEYFQIVSDSGIHLFDHFVLNYAISVALSQEDVKSAEPYIKKMDASIDYMNDFAKSYYYGQLVWRDEIKGDWDRAKMHTDIAHIASSLVGMPTTLGMHKASRALVYYFLGEYEKSAEYLNEAEEYYDMINMESTSIALSLNKAVICLNTGREKEGLQALKKFFGVSRKYGIVNGYHWRAPILVELCSRALQEGIEEDYVRYLIRRRGLLPDDPLRIGENWPWFIKIYTLRLFEVVIDDKPLRFGRKAQQKPIELIQVLISMGGRKVAETKIVDILWPDDDGDLQIKSLHTTVYRLRKLLGYKNVIEYENGRISLNDKICWIDIWAFERLLGEADSLLDGKSKPQQVKQLKKKLFSLYQNEFLSQLTDRFWTIQLREKLKSKFLRVIEQFTNYYLKNSNYEEVIALNRKALEVDPLLESCYRKIMLSYMKLGKTSEAANTYRTCARVLRNSLGVEPSKETKQIYSSLNKAVDLK